MLRVLCRLIVAATVLGSCTRPAPTITVLGTVVSASGKQALTLFAVVQGGILDDYLALNLSEPLAPYLEEQTVASFARASAMRVFWMQTGQPVVVANDLAGTVFAYGRASQLVMCRHPDRCPELLANAPPVALAKYSSD